MENIRKEQTTKLLQKIGRETGDEGSCPDCHYFFADDHKCEDCNEDISGLSFCPVDHQFCEETVSTIIWAVEEKMMVYILANFGWDYAESEDGTGDKFVYWEGDGDMPEWASWCSSCECLDDVYKSYIASLSTE